MKSYEGLPPFFAPRMPPYEKQLEVLRASWRRPGWGFLMEMGTGKSKVTIDNFGLLHYDQGISGLLIIAAKSVYTNWTRMSDENPGELQRHLWDPLIQDARIYTWNNRRTIGERADQNWLMDHMSPGIRVFAINIEALSAGSDRVFDMVRDFVRKFPTLAVIDESTLIKNPKSQRTKAMLALRDRIKFRRILTGYISSGSPTDVYSQFEFLEKSALGHRSFYTFRARYCLMRDMDITQAGRSRTISIESGTQNLDELARLMQRLSTRIRKSECLDLPPKNYLAPRIVELTSEQKRVYHELKQSAMAELSNQQMVTTQIVLTQVLRLQQVVCGFVQTDKGDLMELPSNRMKVLEDLLADTDESVIIWCAFAPNALAVTKRLGEIYGREAVSRWYGSVPLETREAEEVEFQAKRRRFMVATQSAGARGRTWTAATLVVYYSNHPSLEIRMQSEDRAHRGEQTQPVAYVNLTCEGTVDEGIVKSLKAGRSVVDQIMRDGPAKWF